MAAVGDDRMDTTNLPDVAERVAVEQHEIREQAGRNATGAIAPAKNPCGVDRGGS